MSSNNLKCSKRRDAFLAATVKSTVSKDMTQMTILCNTDAKWVFQMIYPVDLSMTIEPPYSWSQKELDNEKNDI